MLYNCLTIVLYSCLTIVLYSCLTMVLYCGLTIVLYSCLIIYYCFVLQLDQESELIEKAKEGMDDEEAQFSVQHELEKQSFLWSDKYRPRKPRFFNRVHTVSRCCMTSSLTPDMTLF